MRPRGCLVRMGHADETLLTYHARIGPESHDRNQRQDCTYTQSLPRQPPNRYLELATSARSRPSVQFPPPFLCNFKPPLTLMPLAYYVFRSGVFLPLTEALTFEGAN